MAQLSYLNRDHLLFFRGQDKDYQSKAGGSTLYPAIYRGDNIPRLEIRHRFRDLEVAETTLAEAFANRKIQGASDVSRKRYIRWSILQHYDVVPTPLLDLTQSMRVACSFAQHAGTDPTCYVYVLGLPYPTNRISINSEEDIVNVRLLSICPPAALRPYYQEGYMAGTPDVTTEFEFKTELDFRNRLIAKFAIPRAPSKFWNAGFEIIPKAALYPTGDTVEGLCEEVVAHLWERSAAVSEVGQLLVSWGQLEERMLSFAREITERNVSVGGALRELVRRQQITPDTAAVLNRVRHIRNQAAHTPSLVRSSDVRKAIEELRSALKRRDVRRLMERSPTTLG